MPKKTNEKTRDDTFIQRKTPHGKRNPLCLLWKTSAILLEMSVRILYLPELHGKKFLGDVLQRHYLAMSRLWETKRIWQSIREIQCDYPVSPQIRHRPSVPMVPIQLSSLHNLRSSHPDS
jgi:hypothetical protein